MLYALYIVVSWNILWASVLKVKNYLKLSHVAHTIAN